MTTAFQQALAKIKDQQDVLENADERAVELGVILPLLRSVGWDTEDLRQIYPQEGFPGDGRDRVDYALQIEGESRVLIEAKRWKYPELTKEEPTLLKYCNLGKPYLAALTNGRQWLLYFKPKHDRKARQLKKFLLFDIVSEPPEKVEGQFSNFLGRKNIFRIEETVKEARKKENEFNQVAAAKAAMAEAVEMLTGNRDVLARILKGMVEDKGIRIPQSLLDQFIDSNVGEITVVTPDKLKPTSFTFCAYNVKETVRVDRWPDLKQKFCKLMSDLHPNTFSDKIIDFQHGWLSVSPENHQMYDPIGQSGIFVKKKLKGKSIKKLCSDLLTRLGYSEDTLTIHYD